MRRLNLTTALTIPGNLTTGAIEYKGLTNPTVTQLGTQTPDVVVAEDGTFTLDSPLVSNNRVVEVQVEDAAGYWIRGPINIIGDGTPVVLPPDPTVSYVDIGMNLAGINGYNGNFPFANVLMNMYPWSRRATSGGSGAWAQSRGSVTATVATDQFVAVILNPNISRLGWTNGTYRVFNPDGCQIAFGYGADSPGAYNSAVQFDISLSPTGQQGVYMFVKGSLTGKVKVVQPGYYDSNGETSTFTTAITGFYNNLTRGPLRFMDWTMASQNYEVEWADRVTLDDISCSSHFSRRAPTMPWEICIDLANTLNRDIWICISPRASADYVLQLAQLLKARLNAGLQVWVELGNEIWNYKQPWNDGYKWVTYLHHTERFAVPAGGNNFTLVNHGLVNDQQIVCFTDADNMNLGLNFDGNYWRLNGGADCYVRYIDADTFYLANDTVAKNGSTVPVYSNMVRLRFKVANEPGKTADRAKHYAELCLRNWDILESELGAARLQRMVCGQAGDSGVLSGILTQLDAQQLGGRARVSKTATAPYFNGHVYGVQIAKTSGTFTPSVWCSVTGGFFTFAVYAAGATPTLQEVIAGTGAISHQVGTSYTNATTFSAAGLVAVTGLSDGTSYKVYIIGWEYSTTPWMFSATITAAASGTDYIYDTYAQQALRMVKNASESHPSSNIAVSGDIPHVSYELGADYNFTNAPDIMRTWAASYMESSECADGLVKCMYVRAAGGVGMLCYFSDCGSGPFSLASYYGDTSDARYVAMAALTGHVAVRDVISLSNVVAPKIELDPGSFPQTIATFADAALTYTILNGNNTGLFSVSGNVLSMANDTGIDWTAPSYKTVTILATDGYIYDTFTVSVMLGLNWYEGDAKFAWSGITDSDPAAINPIIGGTLALSGTPATVSGGMWAMGGAASYSSGSSGSSAGDSPWLVAAVIDRNSDASGFKSVIQFGNSTRFIAFYTGGGGASNFMARFYQSGSNDVKFAASAPTGKHVFWAFWDGTMVRAGYDQVENISGAVARGNFNSGITQYVKIGDNTQMKIGAVESVPRLGMDITEALSLVAKIQAHHSIA